MTKKETQHIFILNIPNHYIIGEVEHLSAARLPFHAHEDDGDHDGYGGRGQGVEEPGRPVHPVGKTHELHQLLDTWDGIPQFMPEVMPAGLRMKIMP
jgi:hypothetical protein